MATTILRGTTSVRLRFLLDVAGLDFESTDLVISTICDNEATPVTYTEAAGNIEDITSIGTYAAPSSGKVRFKEVNPTNHPGLYEFQLADARFNVSGSNRLVISCTGAGLPAAGVHYEVDISGSRDVATIQANAITATAIASNALDGKGNWLLSTSYVVPPTPNEIMGGLVTGSQPNGSLARFVRDIKNNELLFEGQIVSATTDKAILDAAATTVCVGQAISIGVEGDPDRQTRFITSFNPSTKEVTLDRPWCVTPDNAADYQVKTQRNPLVGRTSTALPDGYGEAIANSYVILDTVFPPNFTELGITEAGHIERVSLVDTTTVNTDMRGTDDALVAADKEEIKNQIIVASQI